MNRSVPTVLPRRNMGRSRFILTVAVPLLFLPRQAPAEERPVGGTSAIPVVQYRIQLDTICSGFDKKTCWVHPRAGAVPGTPPRVVLTMQKLLLTGSDVFYALNEMRTDDLGKTWTGPVEHGQTLGRRQEARGTIVAACDFWPKWHAKTSKLLGIGQTVRYRNDKGPEKGNRETSNNDHVFRHRAPLFIAQVDPQRLCVIRATERILVPQRGARLGNFGVTDVSQEETWVTVAEWMQTTSPKLKVHAVIAALGVCHESSKPMSRRH